MLLVARIPFITLQHEIEALRVKVATLEIQNHGTSYHGKVKRAAMIEGAKKALVTAEILNNYRMLQPNNRQENK